MKNRWCSCPKYSPKTEGGVYLKRKMTPSAHSGTGCGGQIVKSRCLGVSRAGSPEAEWLGLAV